MSYNFFAFLSRMKFIKRWSLMHSIVEENIMEHTAQVALISHALCEIKNTCFGGNINTERVILYALFHESGEVITGDLPTPVKYFNDEIRSVYASLEQNASEKLIEMLPDELKPSYQKLIFHDIDSAEYKIVKFADKISAYIKCIEEVKAGNTEFRKAKSTIEKELSAYSDVEVKYFLDKFINGYKKTLDELE